MQLIFFFWASQGSQRTTLTSKGWQWGEARLKDGIFTPALYGFIFPFLPRSIDGENFLTPSLSLGTSSRPVKFYFILICHTIITMFFNKTCFIKTHAKWSGEGRVKARLGKIAISWLLCTATLDYWIIKKNFFYKFIQNQKLHQEKYYNWLFEWWDWKLKS